MSRQLGDRLVTDERFRLLTFTGSSSVGWAMKARAGQKKVILELGGNAGVIIDESADVGWAATRVATGGFAYAGQSCISVQRVFVHESVYDDFRRRTSSARVEALVVGDPLDGTTDVGPMIDTGEVDRIESWVKEAAADGARVLTGGTRLSRSTYAPTVLEGVPEAAKVCAAGSVRAGRALYRFSDFQEARRGRQSFALRPAGRRLHRQPAPHVDRLRSHRDRRRHRQRRAHVAHRPHAGTAA